MKIIRWLAKKILLFNPIRRVFARVYQIHATEDLKRFHWKGYGEERPGEWEKEYDECSIGGKIAFWIFLLGLMVFGYVIGTERRKYE